MAPSSEALSEDQLRRLIDAGQTLVAELDSEAVLRRLLEAARELTGARYAALGVLDRSRTELERFITLGIDDELRRQIGDLPRGRGVLGLLIRDPRPLRLARVSDHPKSHGFPPNHPPMTTFLGVPVRIRGVVFGNLYLTDKEGGRDFTDADEQSAVILAQWAAIAVENARSVAAERLRDSLSAAESERGRWARELHDDTLQGLGALRVALASAIRRPDDLEDAAREVIGGLDDEIEKLRGLITELRPAALDQLGLTAAIEALAARVGMTEGLDVDCQISLGALGGAVERLPEELDNTVYRVIQEALTNVAKHARAERVRLTVATDADELLVQVIDDGVGFDPERPGDGFGLVGMRERVGITGGSLEVISHPGRGTTVRGAIPLRRAVRLVT